MFLSNDLPAKRRDDLEHPELEVLWVEICPSPIKFNGRIHQSLLVGCCYRPPSSTNIFYQYLESVLDKAAETDIVLLGDFNAKHKDWYSEDVTNSHGSALDSFNMSQLVNKPTHLNSEGVPVSLLDLAFTNVPDLFSPMVDVMHPIGLSDHLPVVLHTAAHHRTAVPLAQRASMRTPTTKWCFEQQDRDRMNDAFLFDNWTHVFERAENINETWERWKKQFFDDLQLFLPYRVTRTNHGKNRSSPAWFDKNIRHLIRVKNRLFKRACSTGLLDHRAIYCKARNEANSAIRKAKTAFYVNQANLMADRNCPATKWWHLAKSLCGLGNSGSPTVAPLLNEIQSTVFDDRAKADLLNDTFVNQNNSLNPRGFPYGPTHLKSVFRLKHIPASDVKKAIQRLPNKMSTGSDLISYRLLKAAGPGIVGPLTTLFNLSLKRHEVPNEWKHSVVCPIFKGGRKDRRVPTNYRPISLTSCVARLMEKIINVQVLDYLQSHSLLYKHQSGFLPTHSTVTQLIYLSNKWQMALEKGNHVQTAFLDLSKAYDRVSIPGLLFKLSALGFSTESLKWFSSFLQDRTQCVRVNGSLSSVEYLKSGIPQGTVLGPVLFLIFINDLPSVVENESSIFADDTTMFTFDEDLAYSCRSLTLDLNAASHWAKVWGMLYNAEKSQHLTVRSKHVRVSSPSISMGGVTVPQVDHHKHLGILTKASLGQTTSTKFFHRVLGESACYDACEGYCQTLLFEEFTLALFDPSSNTRVLSGVEVRSQSW